MSRPFKHPSTGVYYFRKAVPDDLRAVVGKREVKRSLRTKDPAAARSKFAVEAAAVDAEWTELRRRNAALALPAMTELDEPTIKRVGEAYYAHLLEEDEDQRVDGFDEAARRTIVLRGEPALSLRNIGFLRPTFEASIVSQEASLRHDYARGLTDDFFWSEVDEVLSWDGFEIRLDPASLSRKRVARELQAAAIRAAKDIRARNGGEPIKTPPYPLPVPIAGSSSAVGSPGTEQPLMVLFEGWWREAKATGRKPSTYESYRNSLSGFIAFLGHDAAEKVRPEDVVRYKDHRLATINPRSKKAISPKTVKDSDLAALKTVLGWAVANHRLARNAAAGITIKIGKPTRLRPKHFTDDEARALLKAADNCPRRGENAKTYAAKRWVPWLLAYTGARVGELAQLRRLDVRQIDGFKVIHITPEAGTVKSDEARDIVLHPHLIEKGFAEFAASCREGHLFIDPAVSGDVLGHLQGLKNRLAEFARATVPDPNVKPNHGWRHRFKTVWREEGLDPRVMDAIQGHAPKTVSDSYGEVTIKAQAAAIAKLPRQGE